jgi:tetratricopeptide (TPR) repeat protein
MGQMDSCMTYIHRFIDANPSNANAYHSAGEMYLAFGDTVKAQIYFQNAFTVDPYFAAAASDLADLFVHQKEYALARFGYQIALERGAKLYGEKFLKEVEARLVALPND